MSHLTLSRNEIERVKFTFSIYDFDGTDKIDANQLGHALRAMGLCPTLRRISNLGGTITRNEKFLTVEEFLAIYQEAKQDKQEGTMEDYMECLSSHDKDRSGKLSVTTLRNLLQGYGEEKLDKDEALEIIMECGDPYDDHVDYKDFLKNLLKGPEIRIPPALLIQQARQGLGEDDKPDAEEKSEIESKRGSIKSTQDPVKQPTQENTPNTATDYAADDTKPQRKIERTRESVKSNSESVSISVCDTEKSEEKKISRRESVKDKKRGSSPEISLASDISNEKVAPRKRSSIKSDEPCDTSPNVRKRASIKSDQPLDASPNVRKRESIKSDEPLDASPAPDARKRASIKSDQPLDGSPEDATRRASRKSSKRSSVKSSTGKLDDRESSPEDITCASEISIAEEAKPMSRTRDSLKSVDEKDRGASPDISWASEEPAAGGAEISKGRSSLKAKGNEGRSGKASPDVSCASDATDLTKSRGSLKSKSAAEGSSKSSAKSKSKKSEPKEEALKAKFQQPLISLKTDGLFGKKKE